MRRVKWRDKFEFSKNGIPILTVSEKLDALRSCIENGSDEDAIGHLFDLLNHIAPNYTTSYFKGIKKLCDYYGKNPTKVLKERTEKH